MRDLFCKQRENEKLMELRFLTFLLFLTFSFSFPWKNREWEKERMKTNGKKKKTRRRETDWLRNRKRRGRNEPVRHEEKGRKLERKTWLEGEEGEKERKWKKREGEKGRDEKVWSLADINLLFCWFDFTFFSFSWWESQIIIISFRIHFYFCLVRAKESGREREQKKVGESIIGW